MHPSETWHTKQDTLKHISGPIIILVEIVFKEQSYSVKKAKCMSWLQGKPLEGIN